MDTNFIEWNETVDSPGYWKGRTRAWAGTQCGPGQWETWESDEPAFWEMSTCLPMGSLSCCLTRCLELSPPVDFALKTQLEHVSVYKTAILAKSLVFAVPPHQLLVMRNYDSVLLARPMSPFHDAVDDQSDTSSIYSGSSGRMSQRSSSSATTQDVEMRSLSPSPSLYSMTDSLIASSYRQEYGRNLQAHSEVYRLPADEEEIERLSTLPLPFFP